MPPAITTMSARRLDSYVLFLSLSVAIVAAPQRAHSRELINEEATDEGPALRFSLGGAVRFNYIYRTGDSNAPARRRGGDIVFDTFRINTELDYGALHFEAEYRFYAGFNMLQRAFIGVQLEPRVNLQVGVMQAPFGISPYSSQSWFFDIGYYVGLEDDNDTGIKLVYEPNESWRLSAAFFKNSEGSFMGSSADSARYSYDIVRAEPGALSYAGYDFGSSNRETNQGNLQLLYRLQHRNDDYTEFGISGQLGQIYNEETEGFGHHYAAQLHVDSRLGPWTIQAGAMRYGHAADNPAGVPDSQIVFGAYDAPYLVAAYGTVVFANLAYTFHIDRPLLSAVQVYNNYSALLKDEASFEPTQQNVLGASFAAGPIFSFVDFAFGRNQPFISENYATALGAATTNEPWELRFNINMGVYF